MCSHTYQCVCMHAHPLVFMPIIQAAVRVDIPLVLGNSVSLGDCWETNLPLLLLMEIHLSLHAVLHIYSLNPSYFLYLLLLCNTDLF